uniref:HPr kinase/phosphorylase n=2 Tax=Oscillospiraceae TaxID=216572 RepID=A0A926DPE5_9FIRM|nr:HPr(Ser) kinase/phosphatase [Congzhengia minquanensis]
MQRKDLIFMAHSVKLSAIIQEYGLDLICTPEGYENVEITVADVNRPSLQLAGFYEYFDPNRIQLIGKVEYTYLESLSSEERFSALESLMKEPIPVVILTRNLEPFPELIACAEKYRRPVMRTKSSTSRFMSAIILYLNVALAPMTQLHGVLVEVYGEGILLLGESGVGKSETAMELVKRGHRLVADDAVEIKRVSNKSLVGSAPEIIRHFIELRGIGIVDVKRIFGMGSVKDTENIDLVINLENWQNGKAYDRLGIETEHTDILGIKVPSLTIPIKPGRNLAIIVEVAAMNQRQRKMGYNAAQELNDRLLDQMGV